MILSTLNRLISRGILAPPVFPGDDQKTLRAKLLNFALLANLVLLFVCVGAGLIGGRVPATVLYVEIAFAAATLVLRRWLFRGYVTFAAAALMAKGFVATTIAIAELGTIRVPVTGFYLALVVATGILFDRRGMMVMIGLSSLAVGGLVLAERAGLLATPDYTVTITQWIVTTVLLLSVGFWVSWALEAIRDALRRSEQEVAERKRVEEDLRASEARLQQERDRLRQILDSQFGFSAVLSPTGEVVEINQVSLALGNLARTEVIGQDFSSIGWLAPGARPYVTTAIAAAARGETSRGDIAAWVPNAGERTLDTVFSPLRDAAGGVTHVIGFGVDVTERKRAEGALKLSEFSVQQASAATLWITPEAGILRVNHAVCDLFGYTEAELLKLRIFDLDPAMPAGRWAAHWEELRAKRRMTTEAQSRHKSGRLLPVELELNWFEFEGREYNFAFVRDLTATRALEQQLRQSQKLEAIGTFAGGIAHDFNNILAGIYGFTALARHAAGGNRELVGHLDEIARSGSRAAGLVRQILDFGRQSGGDEAMVPVNMERIVTEALNLLRAASPSTIEFRTVLMPGLPAVHGDPTQLHQVVMNLGTNAVQAMRDRTGCLGVELEGCLIDAAQAQALNGIPPGLCVRLTISDTGAGMDAVTQQRVFEPFFTTKAPGEGTGLGLSVVHGIVRRHGGAVRLISEQHRGTTFQVFLPAIAAGAQPEPVAAEAPPRGHGERILLVDDEEMIARSGKIALGRMGYAVESDTDVRAAFVRFERDPQAFDLVVSDQTMPIFTGLEFAVRIHRLRADLPVVLATGNRENLPAAGLRAAEVCEVVAKPYTAEELAEVIQRHLPRRYGAGSARR